jgi:hypothetical protein
MSDFNAIQEYVVENISRPVKYIIYKLTEFIRVVDKFVFRQVPTGAVSGYATIEKIEGNTVKWNQLVDTSDTSCTVPNGHKYYSIIGGTKSISTSDGTSFAVTGGTDVVIDLTAIFGSGNEPTTVADFEAWREQNGLPAYADYNAGELLSVKMESLKSIGFNQWDEEVEIGSISENNGRNVVSENKLRSKNYIAIFEQDYYMKRPSRALERMFFYDANKNFLSWTYNASPIKPVSGAMYIRFTLTPGYGTTYNHDICINFFDPAKNGTYKPYMTDSADIDVTTITGINTSTNVREVIFPQGMKQADYAGTMKDTLDLLSDKATVNVGSRAYQSGDESDPDVLTDGTTTYYALTTPIEYTDLQDANGNPLNPRYKVEQGGTEQVLPVNTSTPTTVAPTLTTTYTKDVH